MSTSAMTQPPAGAAAIVRCPSRPRLSADALDSLLRIRSHYFWRIIILCAIATLRLGVLVYTITALRLLVSDLTQRRKGAGTQRVVSVSGIGFKKLQIARIEKRKARARRAPHILVCHMNRRADGRLASRWCDSPPLPAG
jgi:hypothetical protein